ncbi:IS1634 family transposase [Tessaracoccus defluvii]|uniref:IS1634 family transposase n=1 Tax=Tessaracoccus defluvii TaxID=1285901 RepID=A0A7H0H8J5_9ACTN|nr:IS1634 family transposase [Tessaracoccus defluvii]QNP56861.1 IS1634 family transposase [Tessaracoccus defluvii]QNP57070.1 IS1634 family transposase [Tessaracoccus defluvii]
MSPFLRKVKTASGATAVQIVEKQRGVRRIVEHLGSAHSEAELAALMQAGRDKLAANQPELDFDTGAGGRPRAGAAIVEGKVSRLLVDVLRDSWRWLGFDVVADEAFFQLVLARLVEPTSKLDSLRVISELGLEPVHLSTVKRSLKRCATKDYRTLVQQACFEHVWSERGGDVSLLLYDVTTLYFEAEKEDTLRKVGFSKERRVDPQIVVGLLVDRSGFPLEIACFEGDKPETRTIIPVIKAFQERNQVADMVVVADAGMLSATNLQALNEAGLRFIVGSRMAKAPLDLAGHFHWHGTAFTDGQIIDTITTPARTPDPDRLRRRAEPVWDPTEHPQAWRAVWQFSRKRAVRDRHTLTLQQDRALDIIEGRRTAKKARFVKTSGQHSSLDQPSLDRATALVGLKGYVTNIPATTMSAGEVIGSYHDLWHVEQSFRMSKTDLAARPIFHRTRDAIEAHLTIVFTALAIARDLQDRTGWSIRRIIQTLRPLQHVTISIGDQQLQAEPAIPEATAEMLRELGH